MDKKTHNISSHEKPADIDRRRFINMATAATAAVAFPAIYKEHQHNTEHKELPPGFHTITWHITNDQPFPKDGMALAQATYNAQLHHLQTYHERHEHNDFLDGALRITQSHPEKIAKIFAKNGFSAKVAFGLPLQESFFRTGITSRSNALGPYQIKLHTALGVLKNTPDLQRTLLGIKPNNPAALRDRTLRKTIMHKLLNDPLFSAQIAATLLREEYNRYNNAMLAITAYNTGASLALSKKERHNITYERFTTLMMQKIAAIRDRVFTEEAHYVIERGDTFLGLMRKFPHHTKRDLLTMVGGTTALRAGARTTIPLPHKDLVAKVLHEARRYIEPLEYAPKVVAAGTVLAQTKNFAYLVTTPKTTSS